VVLTLLFVWVVDDSLEMSECGLCKMTEGGRDRGEQWKRGRKKRKCLVGLITVIVIRSTAHPADLAEFLALISSENFKCSRIWIDKCVVIVIVISIIGSLRIGMKRGTIRECLEDRIHCRDNE
jgi:hypothetical protein